MRKVLLLLVLIVSGNLSGQGIRQIGTNNGLNHPSVYDIAEDPYGIIWLGTRDGLYRYNDGRAKSVPFLSQTNYRRSTNVQSLCVSQDTLLWIGIQQGGVMALDLKTHKPLADSEYPQLPIKSSVVGLYQDSYGTIWAGTSGDGIYKLGSTEEQWERISYNTSPENVSFGFDFAQQGDSLWFGTSGDRLIYYDLKTGTVRTVGQEDQLNSYRKMVHVQGGNVWFAAEEQGVFRYANGKYARLPDPQKMLDQGIPMNPRDVRFVEGALWVTTDGYGLWKWENEEWIEYSKMDPQLGLITDQFYEIEWLNSELWIGSFNGGVTIVPLSSELALPLRKPDSFVYTSIQSALTLQKVGDDIWVGFDGDGLVRYSEDRTGNWQPMEELEAPKVVTSMLEATDGSVWVGSFREGLRNYSSDGEIQRVFIPYSDQNGGLSNRHIWSLEQGPGDSIWVGTLGGLYLWTGDSMYLPWNDPWEYGRNILDLEQHNAELWVATEYQGIYRFFSDGTRSSIDLSFPVLDIHSVDNKVLFGTEGGGLYAWSEGNIDTLISDKTYSTCYALSCDERHVYALTNGGLITYDRKNLTVISRVNNEEIRAGLFNRKALLSLKDDLLVGASEGVFKVNKMEGSVSENSSLAITEISFDDNTMASQIFYSGANYEEALVIPAGNKSVEFQYEMLGASSGSPYNISYRLEGLSNEWTDLGAVNRTFSLGNLDPGNYTLTLTKTDEDGAVLGSVVLPLSQKAFVYQTVWFRLLIAVMTGLAILGFARIVQERRLRATKLRLLETERELLATRASAMEAKAKEKSDELNFQLLKTSSRVELLKEFKDRLERESVKPNRSEETTSMLKAIIRELNRELQSENYWDHFERNYRDLHDAFSDTLIEQHPKLTKGEVRLSYLIRQKMNNKEIATVLNVSPAAVEKAKYRLKKKIDLGKTDSLDLYIQGL